MEDLPYTPEKHPTDSFRKAVDAYFETLKMIQGFEREFMKEEVKRLVLASGYDIPEDLIDSEFTDELVRPGNEQTFIDVMTTLPFDLLVESVREELDLSEYRAWLQMMVMKIVNGTGRVHKKDECLNSPTFATDSDACNESYQCPYVHIAKTLENDTMFMLSQPEDQKLLQDNCHGDLDEEDFDRASAELWVSHHAGLTPEYQVRWLERALAPRIDEHRHVMVMRALFDRKPDSESD